MGVSPARLLAPVMMMAAAMTALTFYINAVALPAANQAHRELVFNLVVSKARTDVRPRTFTDSLLPGRMMLYVQDIDPQTGLWKNLLVHDTRDSAGAEADPRPHRRAGDRPDKATVRLELGPGSQHAFRTADPREYEKTQLRHDGLGPPGRRVLPRQAQAPALQGRPGDDARPSCSSRSTTLRREGKGRKDWGQFAVEWHKKFAIPSACLVFGLLGLALSLGSKKEARSSAFALSIGVIFVYYVLIRLGEQAGDTGMAEPVAGDVGGQRRPRRDRRRRCCG